jgi:hypothetical protein
VRRENPSFDDVEPPEVATTPIDGMTDEQWAARNERHGRRVGLAFGAICWAGWIAIECMQLGGIVDVPGVSAGLLSIWGVLGFSLVVFLMAFIVGVVAARWK